MGFLDQKENDCVLLLYIAKIPSPGVTLSYGILPATHESLVLTALPTDNVVKLLGVCQVGEKR